MFCIFNWALVVYGWIFIKEVRHSHSINLLRFLPANMKIQTKGRSLEDMENLFNSNANQIRREDLEVATQKVNLDESKQAQDGQIEVESVRQ